MTKSLTAAALSLLVDQSHDYSGVQWSTAVSSLLPDSFVLSDEWATAHITVGDALCHRTGYPRHDYAGPFLNSSVNMLRSFRHLPLANEPRVKWEYNNMMYGTMGYLVETLTNSSLGAFFRHRLWQPMGMLDTYLHPDDALASGSSLAHPYYWNNDTQSYGEVPWRDETNIAGAGMAISSVLDWSRYLRHMIRETGPISKAGHRTVKFPYMVCEERDELFTGPIYYGYGWFGSVFQNEQVWWHSGLVDSMMSIMMMIPSRDFGFIIMLNSEGTPALDSIIAKTLYDYFGVKQDQRVDLEAR
jgi:CubicO group peptidase (beta-lactamase class C family)